MRDDLGRLVVDYSGAESAEEAIARLKREVGRLMGIEANLRAIVSALPATDDGVPVVPGMTVWRVCAGRVQSGVVIYIDSTTLFMESAYEVPWCPDYCYSKESFAIASAEAAAKLEASK